jgi:hypothetical protein
MDMPNLDYMAGQSETYTCIHSQSDNLCIKLIGLYSNFHFSYRNVSIQDENTCTRFLYFNYIFESFLSKYCSWSPFSVYQTFLYG